MKIQMEKHNFVRDGAMRLPPGFQFQPTNKELLFDYLKSKILRLPLPASIIPELLNVSNFDPWDLPGNEEHERYFFTKKESKYRIGNRTNRSTPSGYWKASSSDKKIITSTNKRNDNNNNMAMRGLRKTLVFHIGKSPHGTRTNWFMHEFSLTMQCSSMELEEWMICHIYKKHEMDHDASFSSSSSSSSCISSGFKTGKSVEREQLS